MTLPPPRRGKPSRALVVSVTLVGVVVLATAVMTVATSTASPVARVADIARAFRDYPARIRRARAREDETPFRRLAASQVGYGPLMQKRFTSLAHAWLGVALSLAPIAAWIAIRGPTEMQDPLLLAAIVLFWVTGFDILYACQDADFDAMEGLHSIPARFGVKRSLRIAAISHGIMFGLLFLLAWTSPVLGGPIFLLAWIAVGVLLIYEHAIVSAENLSRVNRSFFQVNAIISIGLLLVGIVQIWVK